jgi:hypothetical protein
MGAAQETWPQDNQELRQLDPGSRAQAWRNALAELMREVVNIRGPKLAAGGKLDDARTMGDILMRATRGGNVLYWIEQTG